MKSLVGIFVVLIVGVIFIAAWDLSSSTSVDDTNYNEIAWSVPGKNELKKVSNSFSKSGIPLCSTYYIKKFSGEKYFIACDEGDNNWNYYTVYTSQNKVYNTSIDLVAGFIPPERAKKRSKNHLIENDSELSVKAAPVKAHPTTEAK